MDFDFIGWLIFLAVMTWVIVGEPGDDIAKVIRAIRGEKEE